MPRKKKLLGGRLENIPPSTIPNEVSFVLPEPAVTVLQTTGAVRPSPGIFFIYMRE